MYTSLEIHGTVNFKHTNTAMKEFQFIRDNNPSSCIVTISETAKVKVDLDSTVETLEAYIFSASTGSTANNRLTIALEAITENGELTLDNIPLYSGSASTRPQVCIIASSTDMQEKLMAITAHRMATVSS